MPIPPPSVLTRCRAYFPWLDGSDIDGDGQPDSLTDGDLISVWKDKSGNDFNASQSEVANKPVYGKLGQVPHLHFDGNRLKISAANIQAKHIFHRRTVKWNFRIQDLNE